MITHWMFLPNAVHCLLRAKYLYGIAFIFLTITSSLVWSGYDYYWVDQFAIYIVVLIGGYYSLQTRYFAVAILSILYVIWIHNQGKIYNTFEWHHQVHLVSSLGHHAILLGLENLSS
jgi:hypothetical protein